MSTTHSAWVEEETAGIPQVKVTLTTDEYEDIITFVHDAIKKEYKDDETCRFYSKLLGKLLILANQ